MYVFLLRCTTVAGCWLLVAGCWLLVAGCWLLAQAEGMSCQRSEIFVFVFRVGGICGSSFSRGKHAINGSFNARGVE
jgi:hypothetical protein